MGAQIVGLNGTDILDVDTHHSGKVLLHDRNGIAIGDELSPIYTSEALPTHPVAGGGFYSIAGGVTAVVAASLAANTVLMSMRFDPTSNRIARLSRLRVNFNIATVGATALIGGIVGIQRFSGAIPTGGTVRTPNKMDEVLSTSSHMTDVRDLNSALTVTSVVVGSLVSENRVPIVISGATSYYEWVYEPAYPLVLRPGDGVCLRTQSIMPATQTWLFDYTAHWSEE